MANGNAEVFVTPTMLSTWRFGNLPSVAASAVNNFIIPAGDNVHGLLINFQSAAPAPLTRTQLITDVAHVREWLNGELIFDRTTTEILDDYKFHFDRFGALAAPLGQLVISCMNHHLPVWDQTRGAALGMLKTGGKPGAGPYNVLSVEVTMTAAAATAATAEVHVITDLYPQEQTGLHIRRLRTTRDLMAIGDNLIDNLPRMAKGLLALHVVTAAMDRVNVTADTREVYRDLPWDSLQILMNSAGRTPQAGYSHIPFDLGNDLFSYLPYQGLSKFIVNVHTTAAPGAGTVILLDEVWDHVRE
ncbi:MAG: hypothetical protein GXY19_15990 [Phycisphaerae bacterium]|nr:hypothetical protein [Phycisphaerae bacterium]